MSFLLVLLLAFVAWYCYHRLVIGQYNTGFVGVVLVLGMIFGSSTAITVLFK